MERLVNKEIAMNENKSIAVVLCGSGYLDGSEIREAVLTLLALSTEKVTVECFAPDAFQNDVVNHLTGQNENSQRNMLTEAARIARGDIKSLSDLKVENHSSIIIPGGFGAAKNLCDFAIKGSSGSVRKDLSALLNEFYDQKKPIGAICIAPAVVALAFKNKNFKLTLGQSCEASQEIEKLGHTHVEKKTSEVLVDLENKIITTPAYMYDDGELSEIFMGITTLVKEVIKLS